MRILLLEDDTRLNALVTRYLKNSFNVDNVLSVDEAVPYINSYEYDVVLLDRDIDGVDIGLSLIEKIKTKNPDTGIIIISSYGDSVEKIKGLQEGADDYLDKPLDMAELHARIIALNRRSQAPTIDLDGLIFNNRTKQIHFENIEILLSKKENMLLFYLVNKKDQIISKDELLNSLYQNPQNITSNIIDATIANIRKKLPIKIITTIKTRGYKVEPTK